MHKSLDIAKWFVAYAADRDAEVPLNTLHALVYYAQGHHLGILRAPLFGEVLLSTEDGPVVPEVNAAFSDQEDRASVRLLDEDPWRFERVEWETQRFLIDVWERYGGAAGWALRARMLAEDPLVENPSGAEVRHRSLLRWFGSPTRGGMVPNPPPRTLCSRRPASP